MGFPGKGVAAESKEVGARTKEGSVAGAEAGCLDLRLVSPYTASLVWALPRCIHYPACHPDSDMAAL